MSESDLNEIGFKLIFLNNTQGKLIFKGKYALLNLKTCYTSLL